MLVQGWALGVLVLSHGRARSRPGPLCLLGLGTALVYPTLIAAMSDVVSPVERAPIEGVYRFWRDSGYALGALIAGGAADALGNRGAQAVRRKRSAQSERRGLSAP